MADPEAPEDATQLLPGGGRARALAPELQGDEADEDPTTRWTWQFPASWEDRLRSFDDAGVGAVQCLYSRPLHLFFYVVGAANSVEFLFALPLALLASGLGAQHAALNVAVLSALAGLVSQVPKRFLWRTRPWLQGRALGYAHDKTSSFPSRALVCACIWPHALFVAFGDTFMQRNWWLRAAWAVWLLLTAVGRIAVGSHFPSDCAAGAALGAVICLMHGAAWAALGPAPLPPCGGAQCPAPPAGALVHGALSPSAGLLAGFAGLSLLLVLLCTSRPVYFWRKFHTCLGLVAPCAFFAAAFPGCAEQAAPQPAAAVRWLVCRAPEGAAATAGAAVLLPLAATGVGYGLRRTPVVACAVLYVAVYWALCVCRLGERASPPQ